MKLNCLHLLLIAVLLVSAASAAIITRRVSLSRPITIAIEASQPPISFNESHSPFEAHFSLKTSPRKAIVRDVTDPFKKMMNLIKRRNQQPLANGAVSSFAFRNGLMPDIVSSLSPNGFQATKTVHRRHRRQHTYTKRKRNTIRKSSPVETSPVNIDFGLPSFERTNPFATSDDSSNGRVPEHVYDNLIKQAFDIPVSSGEMPNIGLEAQPNLPNMIPLAVGIIRIDNDPDRDDSPQDQLGPFATIIREMLKDSKPVMDKHYNEGDDLGEEDYHHKVVSPSEVVVHTPDGYQIRRRRNPLTYVLRRFNPIVKPFVSQQSNPILPPFINQLPPPIGRLFKAFWNKQHHLSSLNNVLEHINSHPDKQKLIEVLRSQPQKTEQPVQEVKPEQQQPSLPQDILGPMKMLMSRMKELEKLKDLLNGLKDSLGSLPNRPQEEQPKIDQSTNLLHNVINNIDGVKDLNKMFDRSPSSTDPSKSPLIIHFINEEDSPQPEKKDNLSNKKMPQSDNSSQTNFANDLPAVMKPLIDAAFKTKPFSNNLAEQPSTIMTKPVTEPVSISKKPTNDAEDQTTSIDKNPSNDPAVSELVDKLQTVIDTMKGLKSNNKSPKSKPLPKSSPSPNPEALNRVNQVAQVLPLALLLNKQKKAKENFFNSLKNNNTTNNLNNIENINVTNNFEGPQVIQPPTNPSPQPPNSPQKHHIKVNVITEPPVNTVIVEKDVPGPKEDPCENQKCDDMIKNAVLNIEVENAAKALK
jgi:hypothetical protein